MVRSQFQEDASVCRGYQSLIRLPKPLEREKTMFYVNMTDKFMSGWGGAAGGKSFYCVKCDTLAQAEAVEKAAHERPEMKRIAIANKPRRSGSGNHTKVTEFKKLGGPWLSYYNPANEG